MSDTPQTADDPHAPGADSLDGMSPEVRKHYGLSAEKAQFPVPEGWFTFGTHVDRPDLRLEFSDEVGEDGLPWWERPILPAAKTSDAKEAR